ncbi:hypothetical protein C9J85_06955 [Haloferax sp. wsp5]|nr:hypothetical protein C9J85_06955 [Haloferax sp. wsp5]
MELRGYVELYEAVYGGEDPVTLNNTVDEIAAYERIARHAEQLVRPVRRGHEDALDRAALTAMETYQRTGLSVLSLRPRVTARSRGVGNGYYQKLGVYRVRTRSVTSTERTTYTRLRARRRTGTADERRSRPDAPERRAHSADCANVSRTIEDAELTSSCLVGGVYLRQQAGRHRVHDQPHRTVPRAANAAYPVPEWRRADAPRRAVDALRGCATLLRSERPRSAAAQQTAEPRRQGSAAVPATGVPDQCRRVLMAAGCSSRPCVAYAQRKR